MPVVWFRREKKCGVLTADFAEDADGRKEICAISVIRR
jgi:hypothetical protein